MQVELFQHILPRTMVKGDIIRLQTTQPGHWNTEVPSLPGESEPKDFANALKLAFEKVNDQQVAADDLTQKMVAEPTSVSLHSVMIAQEKARMSLTFAKNVIDLAVKTYKELNNLR